MLHETNICWECENGPQFVTLQRCWRCLDLQCEHYIKDGVCIGNDWGKPQPEKRPRDCIYKEEKKVLWAWRDELNSSGICVSYSYRFDECCKELDRTDNDEWECRYCKKNVGKVPPPDSCAGCGGHSCDPDCPLHGKYCEQEII